MAYTPINWQTGDTITAEKLNKMDNGWSVDTSSSTLFTETVTTSLDPDYPDDPAWGTLQYSSQITADTITVTFNGTDYQCQKVYAEGANTYGGYGADGPDFTSIPFAIVSDVRENSICTSIGGTYTVEVDASTTTVEFSEDFSAVCNKCVDTSTMPMLCVSGTTTHQEMITAAYNGRLLYCYPLHNRTPMCIITGFASDQITLIPTDIASATFVDGIFTVTV